MRMVLAAAMTVGMLASGLGAAEAAKPAASYPPGTSQEEAAYYNACIRINPALKTGCDCRAKAAMKYSPQLRSDIILSMTNDAKFRARSVKITHEEHDEWAVFSGDTAKQCGIDN